MSGSGSQQWPRDEAGNDDGDEYSESRDGERSVQDDDAGSSMQRDHASVRSGTAAGSERKQKKSKRDSSSKASGRSGSTNLTAEGGESYGSVEHPFQFSFTVEVAMLEIYNESVSNSRHAHYTYSCAIP